MQRKPIAGLLAASALSGCATVTATLVNDGCGDATPELARFVEAGAEAAWQNGGGGPLMSAAAWPINEEQGYVYTYSLGPAYEGEGYGGDAMAVAYWGSYSCEVTYKVDGE